MFRRTLLVLPLATMLSAAPKPAAIPAFKEGLDALSARLWEVAAIRFLEGNSNLGEAQLWGMP